MNELLQAITPALLALLVAIIGYVAKIAGTQVQRVADKYAIICLDSIDDKKEKKAICDYIKESNKEIIAITEAQMHQFAGNMLQVGGLGQSYLVMSQTAYDSLTEDQIKKIENYNPILPVKIDLIEKLGGGSARCMMAEVFLPKK